MFDLVERKIQRCELSEGIQALDVCDQVVIQIEILQSGSNGLWELDSRDLVLSETEALWRLGFVVTQAQP